MGSYPTSPRSAFLEWGAVHESIFTASAAAIGLTPAQALAWKVSWADATSASFDQAVAKEAAKTATMNASDKFTVYRRETANVVRLIKAFAELSSDPNAVYTTAQIPPPADPTTILPPGKPTNVDVSLSPTTGAITLKWKAINPKGATGTSYIVRRKLPTQTAFEFIGVTGSKRFVDSSFNAGPDTVQYTIQGQRSDSSGPVSDVLVINFGNPSGGLPFIQSSLSDADGNALKMAA